MIHLNSSRLSFQADPDRGTFTLQPVNSRLPAIEDARLSVEYQAFGRSFQALQSTWNSDGFDTTQVEDAALGRLEQAVVRIQPDEMGLRYELIFALSENEPLFFWKVRIQHSGEIPVSMQRIELLKTGGQRGRGTLVLPENPKAADLSFYANGWQSWSYTASYRADQSMKISRLGPFQNPMVYNPSTPRLRHPGYFTTDFYGVIGDRANRTGLLAGFLSQQQHFGTVEALLYDVPSIRLWANGDLAVLEPGRSIETDWAVLYPFDLDQPNPLALYLDAAARVNGVTIPSTIPVGWCSWYYYYTNISAEKIQSNLQQVEQFKDQLPLDLVQIDDGYEAQVGDWFHFKNGFPQGMQPFATEIKAAGKTPGLWLAPFIVHPNSKLAKEHPNWLLRSRKGRLVRSGFVWNSFPYALDLTRTDALNYTREVISEAVKEWGYSYLKLDFLYAAALEGQYSDPTLTRAQVLRRGMEALRIAAGPETFLLGCGLPLGSALGLVDAMRISSDVSGSWSPQFNSIQRPFRQEPGMPSARNAIHNTLTRAHLHRRWWINDPDCLLIRPDSHLNEAEVQTLASIIGMTGGSIILSDDLPSLPSDRLRMAKVLLPVIGKAPQIVDWLDAETPQHLRLDLSGPAGSWYLLAYYNPSDQSQSWEFEPVAFHLPQGEYWVRSFWDDKVGQTNNPLRFQVPAHGCVILAVRQKGSGQPAYLGSSLHLSQGNEVTQWKASDQGLNFRLELNGSNSGYVDLSLPVQPVEVQSGSSILPCEQIGDGIYRIPVDFHEQMEITIRY